jgi:hypothetical protein
MTVVLHEENFSLSYDKFSCRTTKKKQGVFSDVMVYAMHTIPPHYTKEALARFDRLIRRAAEDILAMTFNNNAWEQAMCSMHQGGLGL